MSGSFPDDDEAGRSTKTNNTNQPPPSSGTNTTNIPNPLPSYLQAPSVGVWGPPGSGKTILLCSAFHNLKQMPHNDGNNPLGIRWGYEIKIPYGLEHYDQATYRRSDTFLSQYVAAFGDGKLPQATKEATTSEKILMDVTYRDVRDGFNQFGGRIGRSHILEVMDAPGETIFREDFQDIYFQRLRECRAILLTIDGNNLNGDYRREFVAKTGEKYGYNMLIQSFLNKVCLSGNRPFVAVCITQMDSNTTVQGYQDVWAKQNNPSALRDLLNSITDTNMYDNFWQHFGTRFRIFLTSATGWAYQDVDFKYQFVPNVKEDPVEKTRKLINKNAPPLNVLHALLWLLDCVEEEKRQEKYNAKPKNLISRINTEIERNADRNIIHNLSILHALYYNDLGYLP